MAPSLRLKLLSIALLGAASACDGLPKDPAHTTDTVRQRGEMQVGFVEGEPVDMQADMRAAEAHVAARHDVRVVSVTGSEAKLMRDLEDGRLDLVVGGFHEKTPWSKHVALTAFYPKKPPAEKLGVRAATRLGENAWLLSVERALADGKKASESKE